jgi:alpha-amylase
MYFRSHGDYCIFTWDKGKREHVMNPPRLVLALHCHQPTGNVEEIFERAHDTCYLPLVEALERHPGVLLALHLSGPLLEWIEARRPGTVSLVRSLVTRDQVEILGGGWQEPILSMLPTRDTLGQLRTMRYECARLFGRLPRGMWLAERVWEPDVPAIASEAGYAFTFVDDTHLRHAGILDEEITGVWVTEKWGRPLAVLPISKSLRYAIPFRSPRATLDLVSSRPGATWTYGDDGEKFGLWPGTREWVWEKGWLESFLETIESAQGEGRIETVLPSQAIETGRPAGRVYLPTVSYREMGEWALPAPAALRLRRLRRHLEESGLEEEAEPFVEGGCWAGFLSKYPESNWLHKRMLRVSEKVARAERRDGAGLGALASATSEARRDLYRSQTNCAYWHGLFGGLYLPHLRRALWLHLLEAENAVDPVDEGIRLGRADVDCDGMEEIVVETREMTCVVAPGAGACLAELVHRPSRMNVIDTLARRHELYHEQGEAAEQDAEDAEVDTIHSMSKAMDAQMRSRLVYDPLPRRAFQEVLLAAGADLASLERLGNPRTPGEGARVLAYPASMPWDVQGTAAGDGRQEIALGLTLAPGGGNLLIEKRYLVLQARPRVTVSYVLRWDGPEPLEALLVTSINLNLLAGDAHDRFYEVRDPEIALAADERRLASRGTWGRFASGSLVDEHEGLRIDIEASPVCDLVRYPVETVSQSESGFQLTYQGSCLSLVWPLGLTGWTEWRASASIELARLAP